MATADLAAGAASTGTTRAWRSRAFGLELEFDFPAPAFPPMADAHDGEGLTSLRLASEAQILERWPEAGDRVLGEIWRADGSLDMRVQHHTDAGYLLTLAGTGLYLVSPDARSIACAPPAEPPWRWQRGLIGQVLPLASALRGYEVLHASALDVGGRCLLLEGPPGAGKSSLALELVRLGATILAEDVAAACVDGESVQIHPGVAMVNLRSDQAARLEREMPAGATVAGRSDKTHVLLPRADRPMTLQRFYILERGAHVEGDSICRVDAPTPADLIGSTFVPYVNSVDAMLLRLDVAARIASGVPVFRIHVTADTRVERLAERLSSHARSEAT